MRRHKVAQLDFAEAVNRNKEGYVWVPNTDLVIAREQGYNGKNFHETHFAANEDRLKMPLIRTFTRHYVNTRNAAEGKTTLYDASGNPLPKDEAEELWKRLSSNCFTWLNAHFIDSKRG